MIYPQARIGFKPALKAVAVTSSTGRHTPVVDLGGLSLTSIQMTTVGWTDADLSLLGSISSTSTSGMIPIFGSTAAGTFGSTDQRVAIWETTATRILTVDPRLTSGVQYIMLASNATQATTRALVLGLSY